MNNWVTVRLGDVTKKIGSGATPTGGANNYKDTGISLIRSQNVLDLSFSKDGLVYIDDAQANKLSNVIVEQGDILLNITGDSVARSCRVPDSLLPARVNQHVAIIRGDDRRLSNDFLLYYLQYIKPYLLSISGIGGTRNALTKKMIEDIMLNLPPIEEQGRIAGILGALDDKIECNNRINRNLEEQAAVLFRRWFVDFEFSDPDPTSPTYGKPYRSAGGKMQDSPLGSIPKGWQVGRFTDIVDILGGGTPNTGTSDFWNGEIPFFTPKDAKENIFTLSTEKYITNKGLDKCNSKLYSSDTVFITARGTVGKVAIAGCDMAMNQSCYALVGKNGIGQYFVYHITKETVSLLRNKASGAVFDAITTRDFESEHIIIPSEKLSNEFNNTVKSLMNLILTNTKENQTLATLRDTLIPKLMNNEIN